MRRLPIILRDADRAYRRERRHRFYGDVAYLLALAVLYVTSPFNPRAWRRWLR